MSGIVGLWNLDGRPVDEAVLARMSATLAHRGPDGEGRRVIDSAGFSQQHLWVTPEEVGETRPLVGHTGAMLILDGRLDNRDDLVAALGLPRATSDAACLLAAYEAWGERFAERLNGDFAVAVFDPRQPRLVLARDPIGIRPLHYHRGGGFFVFASEIKALLAHPDVPLRPDDDGLADFLMFGSRPLDRQEVTCFSGIAALVASHTAVVTRERVVVRRYWDFDTGRTIRLGSFPEYAEAFRERFVEAVRRRTRSARPVAVSVSGGLDSSSVFCQAVALAGGVLGISYVAAQGSDADERRYLLDIERQYDASIARIPIEPLLGLVAGAEDQVRAIEAPFLDYMWGVTRAVHAGARDRGARVLLSGHWGDQVLFSPAYLVDLFRRFAWGEIARHTREYARWFGAEETRLLKRRFLMDVVRRHMPRFLVPALKALRRRLSRPPRTGPWFSARFLQRGLGAANRPATLGNGFHSAHAESIYLEVRSKYHVHCMEWNNKIGARHGLDAVFPFLDRDLVALLMAVPGDAQAWAGVPRALLREAMRGVLPEPVRARNWKADFTELVNAGVARDFGSISRALSPESLAVRHGYLDPLRIEREVRRLAGGLTGAEAVAAWELADLFGLEVWLQVFLSRVPGRLPAARPFFPFAERSDEQTEKGPGAGAREKEAVPEAGAGGPR
ncbi:MAG: hypothetical protein HY560_11245 [Gemmatimonadetes bacterium]|nr:hypothetical protein [Gemmatimonadota bacterium]